ncbi:hypothetical protein BGW41_004654 [Actinomortierella wolfii]|nr:hypothetical protein BGW41_004654 [Actinomortierella wolfii]
MHSHDSSSIHRRASDHQYDYAPYQFFDARSQKQQTQTHYRPQQQQQHQQHQQQQPEQKAPATYKTSPPQYYGTSMESLLDAIEVHPALSASSASPSRSPSPSSSASDKASASSSSAVATATTHEIPSATSTSSYTSVPQPAPARTSAQGRMAISNLVDRDDTDHQHTRSSPSLSPETLPLQLHHHHHHQFQRPQPSSRHRFKPMIPKPSSSPSAEVFKRKWSNLSSANFEEERNAKIRRSIQNHVSSSQARPASTERATSPGHASQNFESNDPSTRYQMTTICCLHASVAQKSYGSEKRFLCPPPVVQIKAPANASNSGLSSKPQVAMSVICESGDSLCQRSMLEDDNTGTFRFLYVTGTAKAKSFNLKLKVYGRACLPNGFVANDGEQESAPLSLEESTITGPQPEPYAVFDSAPIAIISKPSKKTAKARNVSSCILAGSLISLFNRINSQTVRTKYMSVQDGELCAKNSSWSAFSVTIVSNGPAAPPRSNSQKSHNRQASSSAPAPITYGTEIILTETETGVQSDRLIVCKVENGRILENACGPICQMQKVALKAVHPDEQGRSVYLSAVGSEHQVGRYMDHSSKAKTMLRYIPATQHIEGEAKDGAPKDTSKSAGNDDFLCWTIVGISKFEYTYFESLPTAPESDDEEDNKSRSAPHPITPFPTLMNTPVYNAASHTLELVVSNFFTQVGSATSTSSNSSSTHAQPPQMQSQNQMRVWLGTRGPLTTHVIRRDASSGTEETTLLVDLPQGEQMMAASDDETSIELPLLFVRHIDGITYNSGAKILFTRPKGGQHWTVQMA